MVITLTTDFGLQDPYVGMMRGVILNINPNTTIIDITHDIQSQNIRQGAFLIGASFRFFPKGSIHVVVIDPGVGTSRRALLLVTPYAFFLAPDNGLLSRVIENSAGSRVTKGNLPHHCEAYALTNDRYWHHPIAKTFHGRDIFAPVAAHLSLDVPPAAFGPRVSSIVSLPLHRPRWRRHTLKGQIAHIDRFGNLVTDIPSDAISKQGEIVVDVCNERVNGLSNNYAERKGLLAIIGSLGYLEVSLSNGNAARHLDAHIGDRVVVHIPETPKSTS
jgi:S-adenosylmethionine hydrolase